jgi:RNA polymerase sigma factor (TIGR02999 family)
VLFVAHRDEILTQALETFRRIRPRASLGRYTGTEKAPDADVLFVSVQTLGRLPHLRLFAPGAFDYVIIDEFHHAAAATYRRLIRHFTPRFLLGLTATPERADGGDLLVLCKENLVYRCDLVRGIERGLLCPFHYFGVPDEVDYANIPWRSSRFDEEALTAAVATQKRAANVLDQYRRRAGTRTLAFCCSQRHADFMAQFFRQHGVRAVAVPSGPGSAPRAASLERLEAGQLDVVCCVDMFNEGLDLPRVDTVLMLRPTESQVIWLQQFGRGLRRAEGKDALRVIDYIGNHRAFLVKVRALFALGAGDAEVARVLDMVSANRVTLPPGCAVTYDLKAIDILRGLLRLGRREEMVEAYYQDFKERYGKRPRAAEALHDGYDPRSVRPRHGSWLGFVQAMGDLGEGQRRLLRDAGDFLTEVERADMTRSIKMLVLRALLNRDALPGAIGLDALTEEFARVAHQSAALRKDVAEDDVTRLLIAIEAGDPRAAAALLPLVYDEPRQLAAARLDQEKPGQTLQPTALVHEAYLRLAGSEPARQWNGRGHFFSAAAEAMRRILVENARRKRALKHGGDRGRQDLDEVQLATPEPQEDLLALDEALNRLAVMDPAAVSLVQLRYFAGLTLPEAARALGLSPRSAGRLWAYARAWLRRQVEGGGESGRES